MPISCGGFRWQQKHPDARVDETAFVCDLSQRLHHEEDLVGESRREVAPARSNSNAERKVGALLCPRCAPCVLNHDDSLPAETSFERWNTPRSFVERAFKR